MLDSQGNMTQGDWIVILLIIIIAIELTSYYYHVTIFAKMKWEIAVNRAHLQMIDWRN